MGEYYWDWTIVTSHLDIFGAGLLTTIELTILSCLLGTILAVPVAVSLMSRSTWVRYAALMYLNLARGIPLLVLLIWFHYLIPISLNANTPAFINAVAAIGMSLSGFLADVLRGSASAIPRGHIEAAEALGMSKAAVLRRVVLPEITRRALPGAIALYIGTLKLSTLASVIGVPEILYAARRLTSLDPKPLEIYSFVALLFFILLLPAEPITRRLEQHPWFSLQPHSRRS